MMLKWPLTTRISLIDADVCARFQEIPSSERDRRTNNQKHDIQPRPSPAVEDVKNPNLGPNGS